MCNEHPTAQPPAALTSRSLLIGLGGVVFLSVWTQYAELVVHGTQITLTFPPIGGFIIYAILALLNLLFERMRRRPWLTPAEMVCIFCMWTMASCVASLDVAQRLVPFISGFAYYATPQNDWRNVILSHLPDWLVMKDQKAVQGLYEGSQYGVPWGCWLRPLAMWSVFILAFFHVMFCLVALVREQWINRERLLFPLVVLPLEMVQKRDVGTTHFLCNRVMWLGFAGAFLLTFYVGVNIYFPSLPQIKLCFWGVPISFAELSHPFNAIGTVTFALLPMIIGMAFLFPVEIALSMVFFYWVLRFESVVGVALELNAMKNALGNLSFPFLPHQMAGAFIGLILGALIAGRKSLADLLRRALGPEGKTSLRGEPMTPRSALFGAMGGFVILLMWCHFAGLPVWVSSPLLLLSFIFLLAITRLMAEAGMPWAQEPDLQSHSLIAALFGPRGLTNAQWAGVSGQFFSSLDLRVSIMPRILQLYKMGELVGTSARQLLFAMWIGCLVSLPLGLWAFIKCAYRYGGTTINPYRFISLAQAPGNFINLIMDHRNMGTDWTGIAFVALGSGVVLLLTFLRFHFLWWPLHPASFVMAFSVYLHKEWFSVLIAALLKMAILRYGGWKLYDRVRPFFLGMIFGAIMGAAAFLMIDQLTGIQHHKILY